jgi:hypothetical protein
MPDGCLIEETTKKVLPFWADALSWGFSLMEEEGDAYLPIETVGDWNGVGTL